MQQKSYQTCGVLFIKDHEENFTGFFQQFLKQYLRVKHSKKQKKNYSLSCQIF